MGLFHPMRHCKNYEIMKLRNYNLIIIIMSKRTIKIVGPFNTGTNLLANIIKSDNCVDLLSNSTCSQLRQTTHDATNFDKHTVNISEIIQYLQNEKNLVIIMYKNVYNLLYSIKKAQYSLKGDKLYSTVELQGKTFPNAVELYNFYYINYISLLNKFNNIVFLDYHKLLKDNSYAYINSKLKKLNLTIRSEKLFKEILNKPAKTHGNSVKSVKEAQDKYHSVHKMVSNFVNHNQILKKSIKHDITIYYEDNDK